MGCLKLTYKHEKSKSFFLLHTDEGVVNVSGTNYAYEYFLKDHLGNTRVVVKSDGTIDQLSDYYPFGMTSYETSNGSTNKYLYNGKELQEDNLGGIKLDWYDYGARFYDPQIGRWTTPDPLAESFRKWSPYNYCMNNPLSFNDPDGQGPLDWLKLAVATVKSVVNIMTNSNNSGSQNNQGTSGSSGTANTNSSSTTTSTTSTQTAQNNSSQTNNNSQSQPTTPGNNNSLTETVNKIAEPVNKAAEAVDVTTDVTEQVLTGTKLGSDLSYKIAYVPLLEKSTRLVKPLGFVATGAGVVSDVALSATGKQSWGETGANTAVSGAALAVGGWPGILLQLNYMASKSYMKTLVKHPEWAPYPYRGLTH